MTLSVWSGVLGLFSSILGGVSSLLGGSSSSKAATKAANAQVQAAQLGVDEQKRQFDLTRSDQLPFLDAGKSALQAQLDLLGLGGGNNTPGIGDGLPGSAASIRQQQAIDTLRGSPIFSSLNRQGEEAILQNASATGGLRGGNVQGGLADFRSDLLSQLIQQQFSNLGGISGQGAVTGANLGAAGAASAANIGNLLGQAGTAQAGGILRSNAASQQGLDGLFSAVNGIDWSTIFNGGKVAF